MTDYDKYLEDKRDEHFDAPDHYRDCVACAYSFPEEEVTRISELDDDALYAFLTTHMKDEPSQYICKSCEKLSYCTACDQPGAVKSIEDLVCDDVSTTQRFFGVVDTTRAVFCLKCFDTIKKGKS